MNLSVFFHWFSGGANQYMRLDHCMNHDIPWIVITVSLDLAVAGGYLLIARHWWVNERTLPNNGAKTALKSMRNIFAFCGVCGYIFIPIKMFWPAWRLYDLFMAVLVYFTWKYAWGAKNLKVVYSELGRSTQLAADLEQSREESRRKTSFLNALSHDLRTPLNSLLLQTEVARLGMDTDDPDTVRNAVAEIEESARATAGLLESLLQCAKLDWAAEPNDLSTFHLGESLRKVRGTCHQMAEAKGLTFVTTCPPDVMLHTDHHKLERILVNLADNAVKFTDSGGVRVVAECAGKNIEIHVIDTGIGLSAEQQARLFDEFYQAGNHERNREKGFGLGLAIARRLAGQLGGHIFVASAVGGGSRFTLGLPGVVATGSVAASEPQGAVIEAVGARR